MPSQAAPAPRDAATVLASMSLPQRVGQLFMVGSPATSVDARTRRQIGRFHVGNVILTGRSYSGTRTPARVAAALQSQTTDAATDGVRLFVATDQEGGLVQVLQGPGISRIPTALRQGRFSVTRLRSAAGQWARELRAAGVNMNLAPVMDTVPSPAAAKDNPPIGFFDREYGYTTLRVSRHGSAFARGMAANKVVPVAKHFPGLGRVHANPDTSTGVTDRMTRRGDAYLQPFRAAIDAGVPVVMMSSAYYSRMDRSRPAAFSSFVVGTVLRGDLGFRGVVISDDLGNARQVSPWRPGARAVKFVRAGGDVVLTVNPDTVAAMYGAVLGRARTHPAFRAKVDHAALLVLRLKQAHGLLG
ncbi:MAG: glycoside hydrolase family 3 N-terminal domain-containing protein [Oryzihumus sp.]